MRKLIVDPILWALFVLFIVALAALAMAGTADAAGCNQFFVTQAAYVPVVAYPQVYYQAGRDIEAEALAEKVARLAVPRILEQLRTTSVPPSQIQQKQVQQNPAKSPLSSALAQHCAKCHSGAAPKGGIVYDGQTGLQCNQITAALRAIADNSMPKDHKVSPEIKGLLMEELLNLERKEPSE
jgi:hypothetical protein